jgi:hypothetical protein
MLTNIQILLEATEQYHPVKSFTICPQNKHRILNRLTKKPLAYIFESESTSEIIDASSIKNSVLCLFC